MEDYDVYMVASRLNGEESLVLEKGAGMIGPPTFLHLKEARDLFKESYKVLANLPPTNMALYTKHFEQMAIMYPVIIKLKQLTGLKTIDAWRLGADCYTADIEFISEDILYTRMKPGFIDRFQVLDIVRDIESIPSIGPDGKIIIQQIKITNSFKGEDSLPMNLTPEDVDEILRKRGFL